MAAKKDNFTNESMIDFGFISEIDPEIKQFHDLLRRKLREQNSCRFASTGPHSLGSSCSSFEKDYVISPAVAAKMRNKKFTINTVNSGNQTVHVFKP